MSEHLHYRDSNISLYQLDSNYTLLLKIYPASFSYAVVNQSKLIALAEGCDLKELNAPSEAHDLLTYDFQNIVTGLPATAFSLIPNELYSADRIAEYARFLDVKPNEKVFAQPLDDENYIIYKTDNDVVNRTEMFGLQNAVFAAKGWISAIAYYNPADTNLYLNIDKTKLEILYFANNKLRFYNTFEFHNPDELVYFTTFVSQELALDPQHMSLVLSGDIDKGDKNAGRLAEFFERVELNSIYLLDTPPQIPSNKIMALAALSLCVSSGAV